MKIKRRAAAALKALMCAAVLFIALFPIYWLLAMAVRPAEEMSGRISLLPQ